MGKPGPQKINRYGNDFKLRAGKLKGADGKVVSAEQMEISRLRAELASEDGARHLGKSDGVLRESAELKYAVINRHRRVWPISVQCRVLLTSVAGYHEHFVCRASEAQRRHLSDDALLVHIKVIHAETHGGYGWPRTWKELLVGSDRKLSHFCGVPT